MNFGSALEALKSGMKVSRVEWGGKQWLTLDRPDVNILAPIRMNYQLDTTAAPGEPFPWQSDQVDILALDWELV